MRRHLVLCALAAILVAALAEAGEPAIGPIPTLGEAGVVMLALGLVGGGIAALRATLALIPGALHRQLDTVADVIAGRWLRYFAFVGGLLGALWLLVPIHELLHVLGCVATGGAVTRLELSPWFGGAIMARLIPWVEPASGHAGRLAGFRPSGDLSYLVTTALPHLVLAPLGAWLARRSATRRNAFLFGAGAAAALQPLASLTGDAFEVGSIPVTALATAAGWPATLALRGDDLLEAASAAAAIGSAPAWLVLAASWLLGLGAFAALLAVSGGLAPRDTRPSRRTP